MKYIKYSSLILALGLFFSACETQMIDKLDDFGLAQGGYMRTVTPYPVVNATFTVSKANLSGTKMEAVLEAVTPDNGAKFSSYDLVIKFVDATPANGTKTTTDAALRSIASSSYTKDGVTGYPRHTLVVTGADALSATKLTAADISATDYFTVTASMKLSDGQVFNALNTGANITGGAFYSSPFSYRINVAN